MEGLAAGPHKIQTGQGLLKLHLAVFLFGLAGLFGKFTTCSALYIVLARTAFAALALAAYIKFQSRKDHGHRPMACRPRYLAQGILLAAHWYLFFLSIQVSSVAVGLVTFSSFPLFVTFMEPLWFKEALKKRDLVTAGVVFAGIVLVVPDLNFSNQVTLGAFYGILSGLTFAILALVNRDNARHGDPVATALFQNLFAALALALTMGAIAIFAPGSAELRAPVMADLPALLFLGIACTALSHTLFIQSLAVIRAQTASVITGLEPVYGIVLAFFLLGEIPTLSTLAGGALIIGATVAAGYLSKLDNAAES
ncbi:MAG: DMT family transporter [Desulfobacterales bacterium]|nr:DMT family transporter [Desulfobacterales bacterium]